MDASSRKKKRYPVSTLEIADADPTIQYAGASWHSTAVAATVAGLHQHTLLRYASEKKPLAELTNKPIRFLRVRIRGHVGHAKRVSLYFHSGDLQKIEETKCTGMTIEQAAKILELSIPRTYKIVAAGELKPIKPKGRFHDRRGRLYRCVLVFDPAEVEALKKRRILNHHEMTIGGEPCYSVSAVAKYFGVDTNAVGRWHSGRQKWLGKPLIYVRPVFKARRPGALPKNYIPQSERDRVEAALRKRRGLPDPPAVNGHASPAATPAIAEPRRPSGRPRGRNQDVVAREAAVIVKMKLGASNDEVATEFGLSASHVRKIRSQAKSARRL